MTIEASAYTTTWVGVGLAAILRAAYGEITSVTPCEINPGMLVFWAPLLRRSRGVDLHNSIRVNHAIQARLPIMDSR